MGLVQLLGCHD